jgi:hypothetical protein
MAKSLPEFMKREKTMKLIRNFTTIAAFALVILGVPAIASAQYGQNDPYGRNGGYNNGRYGNYGDMRSTVRDLKQRAGQLTRELDRDLDHSRYNGSRREDNLNELAKDFKSAVNRLSDNNNNYGDYNRRDSKVDRVLNLGSQLDRALSRSRINGNLQDIWSGIEYDLQALGGGYGGYNNNNRNNRNRNGGWNNGNRPSWWPF